MKTKEIETQAPPGTVGSPGGLEARWVVFLLLAGYLLFAHGCHGDEDNELFAWLLSWVF